MKIKFFVLLALIFLFTGVYYFSQNYFSEGQYAVLTRVVDGDTVVLENGERVRLLGINTPERGQPFSKDPTDWLKQFEGKSIKLERDLEDKDVYGRLLRFIYFDGKNLNLELVRLGFAKTLFIEPNFLYMEKLLEAETVARQSRIGVWSLDKDYCIGIFSFHYNARGNDNQNLNDEYVIFRNSCNFSARLDGWHVQDGRGEKYVFGNFTLPAKGRVYLFSGKGKDNSTALFWNLNSAVWNNQGDTLLMHDRTGELMLNYSY